ncbi:hypothetical protein [Flavobacterium lindanitolerans]|jgi:hypothetical protein|uniref:hypothetical protein n=1 Tax=Flavobacterium lindanitolerans TaxID=428988 RepID=UPI0023F01908|nr:hypothetical protein [Flavobacterium lindanitolerans]
MNKELFIQAVKTFNFLTNWSDTYGKRFSAEYISYTSEILNPRHKSLEVLEQFKDKFIKNFYSTKHVAKPESHISYKYWDLVGFQESNNGVMVHSEVQRVLFYYLFSITLSGMKAFLEVVESNEFQDKFSRIVKYDNDNKVIKFSLDYSQKLFNYLKTSITDFDNVYLLFVSNARILTMGTNYFHIDLGLIRNCIKELESYNFAGFALHS